MNRQEHEAFVRAGLLGATEVLAQLRAAVAKSVEGTALRGVEVRSLSGSPVVSQVISFAPGRLAGFAFRETAGAAAIINLRDGDITGGIVCTVALAAGESTRDVWAHAINFGRGLYFELVTGTVTGAIYLGAVD